MIIYHEEVLLNILMMYFCTYLNQVLYILLNMIYYFVIGHTQSKAPDPFRTPKLSG